MPAGWKGEEVHVHTLHYHARATCGHGAKWVTNHVVKLKWPRKAWVLQCGGDSAQLLIWPVFMTVRGTMYSKQIVLFVINFCIIKCQVFV